jgi:4-amino-4-deoxy-L-arabinose transferase-like glycosyltransferase
MTFAARLKSAAPLLLLLIVFWSIAFYGLNFGIQWDEARGKFDSVKNTLETGIFLQGADPTGADYSYGGVNYLLTWSGLSPEIMRWLRHGNLSRESLSAEIVPVLYTTPVRLRVRAIYVILSSLSIIWIFFLCVSLGRTRGEAFLAAAILAGSWEVAYHSRFVAPDVVMMQFVLLAFLCLARAFNTKSCLWLYLGATAVGLAAGTKYLGGLVLPFFLVGAVCTLWRKDRSLSTVSLHTLGIIGMCAFIFVVTTPAPLIDPFRFFGQLKEQRDTYASGWYGYTVKPGISHFWDILKYFAIQMFSHYWTVSLILTAFCVMGFVCLLWEFSVIGLMLVAFPLAYIGYFSTQAAMIVRNLLIVAPFLCLAAARGITVIGQRLKSHPQRILYAGIALLLTLNFGWQIYAAEQVKKRANLGYFLRQFVAYAQSTKSQTILTSPNLANVLRDARLEVPANVVTNPEARYDTVAFFQSEGPDTFWQNWPSNHWGLYETTFGAHEVNMEAYSTFIGNQRILLVTAENFRKLPSAEKVVQTH